MDPQFGAAETSDSLTLKVNCIMSVYALAHFGEQFLVRKGEYCFLIQKSIKRTRIKFFYTQMDSIEH